MYMGDSQLAVWDFRYNASTFKSESDLKAVLKGIAKKWVFQLERGDEGYEHYQGRMSLIKGRRKGEKHILLKLFKETPPNYLEPTSKTEATKGDALYVIKEDTRLKGPWTDKDEVKVETTQLKIFKSLELRPYQRKLEEFARTFDMRKIDIIYDPIGDLGKSLFSEWMEYEGLAEEIPPYRLMDDIFQWVATRPIKPCYIVDMPRGMKKDKLGDFYSGLEVIKNGVAYDKRYNATKIRFNRPRVFVFTNTLPEFSLMSKDRWNVWEVQEDYDILLRNEMGTLSMK
ncbi:replication-associated protein [Avon-Heathcote Estuary associated circular virus 8]|uniref:replication-associated protein n=1 Tax=Avon-Heathcote Estuary associated circular virus 8 TaxID=1618259 RepID=UPI0005CD62E7|nr:replication-associated protein [Avon-Heathcote Estuary associated circular virus 8]AJP36372.1 replication-associated protein [Avon-Heathcote Estuary associated circular virus 8]AJP36373.1 replication-associated protein [Avon-Heathcote Estuary associated circular virus 8]AJP36376.1 replication-associated protein [Avon-Heathcote Estuary associated circular virus 8]AJP36377.1 replication-associated protein [Avon-Heathcote Estuary associated circular virus 8]AJP36380.1 replication-associated pr